MSDETLQAEIEQYRRLADRYERNGQPAMATLLRNVIFLAEGGELPECDWRREGWKRRDYQEFARDYEMARVHERVDGKTDDTEVKP
jgi:hypothetical protein